MSGAYAGVSDANPDIHGMADSLLVGFLAAAERLLVDVREISPPSSLRAAHSAYVESLSAFVSSRDELLAAVATADGASLNELLNNVLVAAGIDKMFERINVACQTLVDYSFVRGGPRPCSAGG